MINLDGNKYEIIKDDSKSFNKENVEKKYTDYFSKFDYIVGDISYGNLRLKGFYEDENDANSYHNKITLLKEYIEKKCSYGCAYFVMKKIK